MRVALAHRDLHQATRGGICTVYKALARQLAARGASVTLITQHSPRPVRISGVTTVSLPRTENRTEHRNAVALAIDQAQPDVVDCSTWEAETLHYLARPRTRRSPVLVRGEFSAARLGAWQLARDEQRLVHAVDQVIAVSDYAARDLAREYGIALPPVVANGVDRTAFRPGPVSAPASGYRVTLDGRGQPISRTPVSSPRAGDQPVMPWDRGVTGFARLVWVGKITPMKGWDILEAAVRRRCGRVRRGFIRAMAAAVPRCGGRRGWRSRAGSGPGPGRRGVSRRCGRIRRGRR
jgi:D-inositol-3-phosphate glycosyltransferase